MRNQKVSLFIFVVYSHHNINSEVISTMCTYMRKWEIRMSPLNTGNIFSHPSENSLNFVDFFWKERYGCYKWTCDNNFGHLSENGLNFVLQCPKREIWMLQVNGDNNFGHLSENGLNFVLQCPKRPIPFYATRYAKTLGFNISWISINKGMKEINKNNTKTGFPLGLGKWDGIFQSGKSQGQ